MDDTEIFVTGAAAEKLAACYSRLIELGRRRKTRLAQEVTEAKPGHETGSRASDTLAGEPVARSHHTSHTLEPHAREQERG